MAGRISFYILAIAIAAPAVAGDQGSIDVDKICRVLSPGISITIGHHKISRNNDGGCLIENMNVQQKIQRPAPTLKSGEVRS